MALVVILIVLLVLRKQLRDCKFAFSCTTVNTGQPCNAACFFSGWIWWKTNQAPMQWLSDPPCVRQKINFLPCISSFLYCTSCMWISLQQGVRKGHMYNHQTHHVPLYLKRRILNPCYLNTAVLVSCFFLKTLLFAVVPLLTDSWSPSGALPLSLNVFSNVGFFKLLFMETET